MAAKNNRMESSERKMKRRRLRKTERKRVREERSRGLIKRISSKSDCRQEEHGPANV